MTTGFVQRFKGKIAIAWKGIYQGGGQAVAVFWNVGAPVNGTSGTFAGIANPGALLATTEPAFYQNTNTLASPTWSALTTATGSGTYTGTFDGVIGGNTPAAATVTTLVASSYVERSVGNALTAVGTNRATALVIAKDINNVTTAASGTGVVLPAGVAGMSIDVYNGGANLIQVYGNGSDTIDTVAGATGVPLTNAKRCNYKCVAANTWISAQLGVISA